MNQKCIMNWFKGVASERQEVVPAKGDDAIL